MGGLRTPDRAPAPPTPASASSRTTARWPFVAFWLGGALLAAVKLVTVLRDPGLYRILAFNSDDLHYYVLTALHAAAGDGSTFDGLQETNGYQPLWFLLLTAAFKLTGVGRSGAYLVTMALLVSLWVAALWLLHRLGRRILGPYGTLAVLAALLVHGRWWTGCENALVVVLLLAGITLLLERRLLAADPVGRDAAMLGGVLALLVLSRLDTAVLVAVLTLVAARRWRDRRLLLLLVGPPAAALAVYAAVNQALFGVAVPVSGLAKQLGPKGRNLGVLRDFLLYGQLGPLPLLFGVCVLVAAGAAFALLGAGRSAALPDALHPRAADLRTVIVMLVAAQVGQLAYYAVASTWELQGWYFSFGVVALLLSCGVIGARIAQAPRLGVVLAAVTALLLTFTVLHEVSVVGERDASASPTTRDIDAGRWADRTLPPGAVVAMGDWAGSFAATTQHPVVQLEGLVGSPAYLDALQSGTVPQYLASLHVDYYARLLHPGEQIGCAIQEPYFGGGPKTTIDVCGHPVVYRGSVQGVVDLMVWDLRRTS